MRTLGNIEHPTYLITVLEMNKRLSLQIEDGELQQTYRFRDGEVEGIAGIKERLTEDMLRGVKQVFDRMMLNKRASFSSEANDEDFFPNLI